MEKIALICDSTSDLHKEIYEKYNIEMVPFRIIYKDREFLDNVTISPQEVYNNLSKEVPTTSLPSLQTIDEIFYKIEKEGYTHAIVITVSSGLSGTFNAMNLVSQNHPDLNIHIFDSKTLTMGTGATVLKCAKMIEAGISFNDIIEELPRYQDKISVFYVIDTLEYLKKGGRIGKVSGTIGELLNLKPIISVNKEGIYYTYEKARGKKQGLNKLFSIGEKALNEGPCSVFVLHGGAESEAKALAARFQCHPNLKDTYFGDISPSAGVHTGPGLVGIVVIRES